MSEPPAAERLHTLRAETSLRDAANLLAIDSSVSYVVEASAAETRVSVNLRDMPLEDVVALLARSAGVEVLWRGGAVYFGSLKPSDRAVCIRRVSRGDADELRKALGAITTQASVSVSADGIVIVSDTVDAISRINDTLDAWEAAKAPVWVVELIAVSVSNELRQELSIDGKLAGSIALAVSASPSSATAKPVATAAFDALLNAIDEDADSWVDLRPLLTLADGESSRVSSSQRVPYARSVVLESGAVAENGFDFVEAGTVVEIALREHGKAAAAVDLSLELTEFVLRDAGPPAVVGSNLETVVVCDSGRTYLVGSISTKSESQTKATSLKFGWSRRSSDRTTDVYLRAVRLP